MKKGLIYFQDGEIVAESNNAKVYRFNDMLHLEIGPGHNLWAIESELKDYIWQLNDRPNGECLEIGLGLGVASKYILSCPKVKTLTTVEKNDDVIKVHKTLNPITPKNHIILNADGLYYMYETKRKFDFIFLDFYAVIDEETLPIIKDFSEAAKKCLKPDGEIVGWFDTYTPEIFVEQFFNLFKKKEDENNSKF
jgi:hypothetical protein